MRQCLTCHAVHDHDVQRVGSCHDMSWLFACRSWLVSLCVEDRMARAHYDQREKASAAGSATVAVGRTSFNGLPFTSKSVSTYSVQGCPVASATEISTARTLIVRGPALPEAGCETECAREYVHICVDARPSGIFTLVSARIVGGLYYPVIVNREAAALGLSGSSSQCWRAMSFRSPRLPLKVSQRCAPQIERTESLGACNCGCR